MDGRQLRQLFALANAFKEGDLVVGGTRDEHVRADARRMLMATTIGEIRRTVLVDDGVTQALDRGRDRSQDAALDGLTVAQLKERILRPDGAAWVAGHREGLASEAIAALAKVMTNGELSAVARSVFNPLPGERQGCFASPSLQADGLTIGAPGHFGSRIQPNSPGDDEEEILFSVLEGLSYGCGDVIIGLNPASDDLDTIVRLEQLLERIVTRLQLPTRYCVLSDIVKQHQARQRVRVDVGFQSLAGTSRTLAGMVGLDVDGILDLARDFDGLYFETGQGSAVTNGTDEGVDMVTLESRAYGVARLIRRARPARPWMIVNDVAGFIGPEVFATEEQLERACLEDVTMARLHGITMGLDVCATFHMGIDPNALRRLTGRIVEGAAPSYLMAVAGNADPMLGYMTTSFRDHPRLRTRTDRRMASSMEQRLTWLAAAEQDGTPRPGAETTAGLYAAYAKAGGDSRSTESLADEGHRRLFELQERGFNLGLADTARADARLERVYTHARAALYATLSEPVIRDATTNSVRVRTAAASREDYLSAPPAGERVHVEDMRLVSALYPDRRPDVQFVVSDGLNASAVNEQLRQLLPPLRRVLAGRGCRIGGHDIVVRNGRVRAGYDIGGLTGALMVVHLIGERPGTGLNTVSAYITYGRDVSGQPRWSRSLDHSCTNAICGIHVRGTPPDVAVTAIADVVSRCLVQRRSGVGLGFG